DGVAFLDPEQDVARVQRGQLRRRGDDVLQLGLRVTPRAGEQQLAAGELVAPVAHQLRAAGAGVGGVDEELRALDPGDVEVVVDEIGQRLAGDRRGQGDAVVDADLEQVERQVEALADAAGEAQAQVHRLLRIQV